MFEIPRNDPVLFPLPILTTFDGRPSYADRRVPIQPLLSEHRNESGKEGGSETGVQDTLHLDDGSRRARPQRQGRGVTTEGGVVDLVDQDAEEGGSLFVGIRLKLRLDLNDERRCHGRKQTGLPTMSVRIRD